MPRIWEWLKHRPSEFGNAPVEFAGLVRDIQRDEDQHLAFAESQHDPQTPVARLFGSVVSLATEPLILISTRGDSFRIGSAIAAR